MASVDQPFNNQTDQDPNQAGTNSSANSSFGQAPQLTAGQGATTGGAPAQSGGAGGFQGQGTNAPTNSGAYPNLQKYMQANQNWNAGQGGLGGEVASNLNQQGQQVQQGTQQANEQFQNQGNAWQQNTQNAANAFNQGVTNAYGFTQNNPQAQQQAGQALNAQYQGPQNLFGANQNLQQQAQNYNTQAGQTQTEAGRYNLLQQMFGGQNYTQGQQKLDQSLLQTNPQQMGQLKGAFQQATQQQQNLQNLNNQAQQQAQNWQNFGQQTQQGARQALNSAIGTENQAVQQQYQTAANQQAADIAALKSGNISQDLATQLGLTANPATYGVDASQFVNAPTLNLGNTATQQDYNQIAALRALSGASPQALSAANSSALQQDLQSGAAGTSAAQMTLNNPAYQQSIAQNKAAYEQAITPLVQQLNRDKLAAFGIYGVSDPSVTAGNAGAYGGDFGLDTLQSITPQLASMFANPMSDQYGQGQVNASEANLLSQAQGAYNMYNPLQGLTITPTATPTPQALTPNLAGMMANA